MIRVPRWRLTCSNFFLFSLQICIWDVYHHHPFHCVVEGMPNFWRQGILYSPFIIHHSSLIILHYFMSPSNKWWNIEALLLSVQAQFGLLTTLHDCYVLATGCIKTIKDYWSALEDWGIIVHYAQNQRTLVLLWRFRSKGQREGEGTVSGP